MNRISITKSLALVLGCALLASGLYLVRSAKAVRSARDSESVDLGRSVEYYEHRIEATQRLLGSESPYVKVTTN